MAGTKQPLDRRDLNVDARVDSNAGAFGDAVASFERVVSLESHFAEAGETLTNGLEAWLVGRREANDKGAVAPEAAGRRRYEFGPCLAR